MINKINGCQCFNRNVANNNNPKKHYSFNLLSMVDNKSKNFIVCTIVDAPMLLKFISNFLQFKKHNYNNKQFICYINNLKLSTTLMCNLFN